VTDKSERNIPELPWSISEWSNPGRDDNPARQECLAIAHSYPESRTGMLDPRNAASVKIRYTMALEPEAILDEVVE
jgi:hypothetical protein